MTEHYLKATARFGAVNALYNDEEIDFIYRFIGNQPGVPANMVGKNLERLRGIRLGLYEKFMKSGIDPGLDGFKPPKGDTLFGSKNN